MDYTGILGFQSADEPLMNYISLSLLGDELLYFIFACQNIKDFLRIEIIVAHPSPSAFDNSTEMLP